MTTPHHSSDRTLAPQTVDLLHLLSRSRSITDTADYDIIRHHFGPETLTIGTEPKLFWYGQINPMNVPKLMMQQGFKPGSFGDLLTYGHKNPEEQKDYPIAALGSIVAVNVTTYVACLDGHHWDAGGRVLRLSQQLHSGDWHCVMRYLGVLA